MEFPQAIKDKYIVRPDYLEWLQEETAIFVYIDLTNMFHWQDTLGWRFRIEDAIEQLRSYPNIKEIKVYYGLNERDKDNSEAFHNRIKKSGAILRTKPMKFLTKSIREGMLFQRKTLTLFDGGVKQKIQELIDELQKSNVVIEEPKCNFDVEMAMDMLDDAEKLTSVILFSGDSDLNGPLERLKIKGKKIGVMGVRGMIAKELGFTANKCFDFGKFYTGKKTYIESENPAEAGPHN